MRARDLADSFPTVTLDSEAIEAARAMAEAGRPGLVVLDDRGRPLTVLPGSQVLRFAIPRYVQEDPHLARVYGEQAADEVFGALRGKSVRELLPEVSDQDELPVVDPEATSLEIAAVMARRHSPIAIVMDGEDILGVVTVSHLLRVLLADTSQSA